MTRGPRRRRPRLRTVFVAVNVSILLIPLGGVVLLRLYESALIRRTETALIAHGAIVAAAYHEEVLRELERLAPGERMGYGRPAARPLPDDRSPVAPRVAQLDLRRDPVFPRPAEPTQPAGRVDPIASAAGERLTPILRQAQRTTLAGVQVVSADGVVVASTRGEIGLGLGRRDEVRRALSGEHVSLLRRRVSDSPPPASDSLSRSSRHRVFVALPVRDGDRVWGAVVLSRTPMSVGQSLYGIRWHIAAGAAVLLFTVVVVSAFTSRNVTRPVEQLIRQTGRVAAGDRSAMRPLDRPGTHEVAQLSDAFVAMAHALDQRSGYITAFAGSVSHEFKTPLAAMRGAIELLRDHFEEMSPTERERFLGNLDADAKRLQRLTGRLLELARADVLEPRGDCCAVAPVVDALTGRLTASGLQLSASVEPGVGRVRMADATLESILDNLVANARRHGGDGVHVTISAKDSPDRRSIEIAVSDDGPGISEANRERIFDAFFTTARDAGGTGLGLPIVRALATAHDGSVDVDSAPGRTVFRVTLPAAPIPAPS